MEATFFATRSEFRAWLEANHDRSTELWVGFHKKGTGLPSITYPEAVDEALCFGWIDGVRHSIDASSYCNRFTPRRPRSKWSEVNVRRARELIREGRMTPAGLSAFERRPAEDPRPYSYERQEAALDGPSETRFRENVTAWAFFQSQPPHYRRTAIFWVVSAKREETRRRRLETLIADSAAGLRIGPLRRPEKG